MARLIALLVVMLLICTARGVTVCKPAKFPQQSFCQGILRNPQLGLAAITMAFDDSANTQYKYIMNNDVPEEKRSDPLCEHALKSYLCSWWLRSCDEATNNYAMPPCRQQCEAVQQHCGYSGATGCAATNTDCTSDASQSAISIFSLAVISIVLLLA